MTPNVHYMIRELTVINYDGQFSYHKLVYLKGERIDDMLCNILITQFERELPGVTYIGWLTLKETYPGKWQIKFIKN